MDFSCDVWLNSFSHTLLQGSHSIAMFATRTLREAACAMLTTFTTQKCNCMVYVLYRKFYTCVEHSPLACIHLSGILLSRSDVHLQWHMHQYLKNWADKCHTKFKYTSYICACMEFRNQITIEYMHILADHQPASQRNSLVVLQLCPQGLPRRDALLSGKHLWIISSRSFAFTRPPYVSVYFNLILSHRPFEAAYLRRGWGHGQPHSWAVCCNIQVQRCQERKTRVEWLLVTSHSYITHTQTKMYNGEDIYAGFQLKRERGAAHPSLLLFDVVSKTTRKL